MVQLQFAPAHFVSAVELLGELSCEGLAGCWRADAGALNRIVQLWSVPEGNDAESFARDRATELVARSKLPIEELRSTPLSPLPFDPGLERGKLGGIYELREYRFPADAIPDLVARWGEVIDRRAALAPLVGAWQARNGAWTDLFHLWAYRDANAWQEIRALARARRIWPPRPTENPSFLATRQESLLLIPLPSSKLC